MTGSGEHQTRRHRARRLVQLQGSAGQGRLPEPRPSTCCKRPKCRPTARRWSSPAPRTITSSRKSMRSRTMSKTAAARSSCSIRRCNSAAPTSPPTMRSPACSQSWGVTLDKDLILDLNPVGQLAGLGPQVALVTTYGTQPIVADMRGTAAAFLSPVRWRFKSTDKTAWRSYSIRPRAAWPPPT